MKLLRLGIIGILGIAGAVGEAAETHKPKADGAEPRSFASKFCDPVCELKSQDAAFSLLLEGYRQHEAYHIESDYQGRLQQIANLKELRSPDVPTLVLESNTRAMRRLRELVLGLVRQEREVRLSIMETRVANFQAAYSCVRKIDEDYLGERVPRTSTPAAAQKELGDFVAIIPGSLAKGDIAIAPSVPASSVLLLPTSGTANPHDLVEPCD